MLLGRESRDRLRVERLDVDAVEVHEVDDGSRNRLRVLLEVREVAFDVIEFVVRCITRKRCPCGPTVG